MRIRVENPTLLSNLCAYLERDGCVTREVKGCEAEIAIPGAMSEWEVTETLKMEIGFWQARYKTTQVVVGVSRGSRGSPASWPRSLGGSLSLPGRPSEIVL